MTESKTEAKSGGIGSGVLYKVMWLLIITAVLWAINPLVKMGEPWIWVHAGVIIFARRFWVGKLF